MLYFRYSKKEVDRMKWIYLDTVSEMGMLVDEYTNEEGTLTRLILSDGYEKIFENN